MWYNMGNCLCKRKREPKRYFSLKTFQLFFTALLQWLSVKLFVAMLQYMFVWIHLLAKRKRIFGYTYKFIFLIQASTVCSLFQFLGKIIFTVYIFVLVKKIQWCLTIVNMLLTFKLFYFNLSNLFIEIETAFLACLIGKRMVMINDMQIENSYSILLW